MNMKIADNSIQIEDSENLKVFCLTPLALERANLYTADELGLLSILASAILDTSCSVLVVKSEKKLCLQKAEQVLVE